MEYHDATAQYMRRHGRGPNCSSCGKEMFPQDDHGRFTCFCNIGGGFDVVANMPIHTPRIPQVDTSGMANDEKAQVAPINRLESKPTEAEAKVFSIIARGPEAIGSPEYVAACKALEDERKE